jgi:hypothetical protein
MSAARAWLIALRSFGFARRVASSVRCATVTAARCRRWQDLQTPVR